MGLSCAGRCAPLRRGGKGVLQRANSDRAGGGTGPPGPPNHRRGAEGARRGCGGALGGSGAAQPPPRNAQRGRTAPGSAVASAPVPALGLGRFPKHEGFSLYFLKKGRTTSGAFPTCPTLRSQLVSLHSGYRPVGVLFPSIPRSVLC